jgi:hypothetical protein
MTTLASKSVAIGAAISLILAHTGCVNGRLHPAINRVLSDDEKNQLSHCHGILIKGDQSYQLFNYKHYPACFLQLGKNPGKKLEFRDPFYTEQVYLPKVTFDQDTKRYLFSFDDQIEQPKVNDPDLTIEVSDYQEEYGSGIDVGPGFSDNPYVATSVRVTVTHKVLGVLYQGGFRAEPPLIIFGQPKATVLDTLARLIRASPVGSIVTMALADGN